MRTVTFSQPAVIRELDDHWVSTWFDQAKDSRRARYEMQSEEVLHQLADGAGGGNVRTFFCDSKGRIVHYVQGFYGPESFLREAAFAKRLLGCVNHDGATAQIRALHEERRAALTEALNACAGSPDGARQSWPLRVLLENHKLSLDRLLQDPSTYMVYDRIEKG